jgi:tetratricopeptide (TPR) repeat protein
MADVIQFTPRNADPSGLLRAARKRSGLDVANFAALVGRIVGRPELSPGTLRAWEGGTIPPPVAVLTAAQQIAPTGPTNAALSGRPAYAAQLVSAASAERASVEAVMQAFRDADREVGGGYMYGAVVRYLEHQVAPILFRGDCDQFCAAAALTEMAGWMAHDAGDDALAQQHFERALRFASVTDDVELVAHIHASLSHLAQHLNNPRAGLRYAQAGRAVLRRRAHHPALSARLQAMEARALATLRRRADCERALITADRALDRTHTVPPSTWVSPFDRASLAAEASVCMQQLHQLAAARAYSEQVLALRHNGHARSRAFGQLRLAAILVSQGEVEHACTVSLAALASSERLSSSRVTQLVQSLHVQLLPHASSPGVDQVVQSLAAAITSRAHARLLIAAAGNSGP